MTALTITAANVILESGPVEAGIAGEAFAAGACVYRADNGRWLKAQCDGTAVEAGANELGMALATADVALARVQIALPGAVVAVGTGTAGVVYVPGDTAGSYMPVADANSTDKVTVAAIGCGTNRLKLGRLYNAGSALA